MTSRGGSTLVELMLSMSAGSAVMLLGISLVHQTMTLNTKSTKGADHNRTLDRLAHQFRHDLHSAAEMQLDSDNSMKFKNRDGSMVTYLADGSTVVRKRDRVSDGDERERFVLESESSCRFSVLSQPPRASLVVFRELGLEATPPRVELMVEALLGRWRISEESDLSR